jgi:hypothetical protein
VKIAPKDAPDPNPTTGVEEITNDELRKTEKVLRNGQLLIERNGRIYDAQGKQID